MNYQGKIQPDGTKHAAITRMYSVIDLFAGCGGLSLGLEHSGFTPVFVNELHQDALDTYLSNRFHKLGGEPFSSNNALHCNDVAELDSVRLDRLEADLRNISELHFARETGASAASGCGTSLDLIAGGPPCQGYSGIGHRRSYAVEKVDIPSNRLYARMAATIAHLRPRIFLFENVRGLLNARWTAGGARIFPDVLSTFRAIEGYTVRWSLVHAKDYGVPQNRPRVLLVGIRNDVLGSCNTADPKLDDEDAVKCGFLPAGKKGSAPDLSDLLGDLVDPTIARVLRSGSFAPGPLETSKYPKSATTTIQKSLRRLPLSLPAKNAAGLTDQVYSKHAPDVVAKFDHMLKNNGEIPTKFMTKKFSQRVLPKHWAESGPTITATSLPDDYVHFSQPRILTVREWARLQLFPDWYRFKGKRTTGGLRRAGNPQAGIFDREVPKYTQIGNAVPVGLAQHVGRHLRKILDEAI